MKRLAVTCFSIGILAISGVSSAAVIERDWKSPGDGLLTYDTSNKREWLDLSQTLLSDQFPGTGSTPIEIRESRYQYVVGQTAPGGLFEGFKVAKSGQVIALAESAGIDTSTLNYITNSAPTLQLEELLSFTIEPPNGYKFSIGLLNELGSLTSPFRQGAILHWSFRAGLTLGDPVRALQSFVPPGVMLYRAVPEPTGSTLVLLALSSFNLSGRFAGRCLA